jgi:hypothetical protein
MVMTNDSMSEAYLNFYGCVVKVVSLDQKCVENAHRDFSYFFCPQPPKEPPSVTIRLYREAPPQTPAQAKRVLQTKEGICYEYERIRYVDYSGKALARYDFRSEEGKVFSLDDNTLHEISYVMILSRVGEMLDRRGIHRIHSVGVAIKGSAAICLLPTGGGKTTLGLELMKEKDCFLLSDEVTAIDRSLHVLPFPLRIGLVATDRVAPEIPVRHLRSFHTIAHGTKTLIDLEVFMQKVATEPARLEAVMFGVRKDFKKPELKRLSRLAALQHVLKNIACAYQLPQTKAYFFRFDLRYLMTLCSILISRILTGIKIALSVNCYRLCLTGNRSEDAKLMANLLRKRENKETVGRAQDSGGDRALL